MAHEGTTGGFSPPIVGYIKLGTKRGNEVVDTDCFHVPENIEARVGKDPKTLNILFVGESIAEVFPCAYKRRLKRGGFICVGDGKETARFYNPDTKRTETVKCPCEHLGKTCKLRGHLKFLLPEASMRGVYVIETTSRVYQGYIMRDLEYISRLTGGLKMIPLVLSREPIKVKNAQGMVEKRHKIVISLSSALEKELAAKAGAAFAGTDGPRQQERAARADEGQNTDAQGAVRENGGNGNGDNRNPYPAPGHNDNGAERAMDQSQASYLNEVMRTAGIISAKDRLEFFNFVLGGGKKSYEFAAHFIKHFDHYLADWKRRGAVGKDAPPNATGQNIFD